MVYIAKYGNYRNFDYKVDTLATFNIHIRIPRIKIRILALVGSDSLRISHTEYEILHYEHRSREHEDTTPTIHIR